MCLGPTRSGKTSSILLTTLLSWPWSMIVYDPKGELYGKTAGWRAWGASNTVIRFAPADVDNTARWNPFSRVRTDTPYEYRDVANIIGHVVDPKGKGPTDHWEPTAANYLVGVALHCFRTVSDCSLSTILDMIDDPADEGDDLLNAMASAPHKQISQVGRGMLNTGERERQSIVSTARRLLNLYRDPVIAKNTDISDFLIDDLMNGERPLTLYIEARGEDELRLRPLVRLFLTLAVGQLISYPPMVRDGREVIPHKYRMILAIDELASLGESEPLELALSKSAAAGITALLLAQDHEQIVKTYGPHETIAGHCAVLAAFAPTNQPTSKWLSDMTGSKTVVTEEISESTGMGRKSQSMTYRSTGRPLMTADQIRQLQPPQKDSTGRIVGPGEMLIFYGGHVIKGVQSLDFLSPEFVRRSAIPAPETMRIRHGENSDHSGSARWPLDGGDLRVRAARQPKPVYAGGRLPSA